MLRRALVLRVPKVMAMSRQDPLDVFTQIQLGSMPSVNATRLFLTKHFDDYLFGKQITESRVNQMDVKQLQEVLRGALFERYVSVPFGLFCFDLEFTGIPRFTNAGPSESIVEIGMYSPDNAQSFTRLIRPARGHHMSDEAARLTGITDEQLQAEGIEFGDAWRECLEWMNGCIEGDEAQERVLLLSHGGKLADVGMLQHATQASGVAVPQAFQFGDTHNTIRDLHRRRPVTKDKLPPSWALSDLGHWLDLDVPSRVHRADVDAALTWDVLSATLERYGDDTLTPRQQLVSRFYDELGKESLQSLTLDPRKDSA